MAILVATHPLGAQRLQGALADYAPVFVDTLDAARELLGGRAFSCVILGVQFAESQTLALLDYLRSHEAHRATPVVCVIGIKGRLSDTALGAFAQAARALGARAVIDMEQSGSEALRRAIDQVMLASPAASPPAGR